MKKRAVDSCVHLRSLTYARLLTYAAGLASLALSIDAGAEIAQCTYSTHLTAENTVVIDANSGAILSSTTQFPTHRKRVDLYFVNKNPFGFTYSFEVKGTAIEEGVIRGALEKIGVVAPAKVEAEAQKANDAKQASDAKAAAPPTTCGLPNAQAVADSIRKVLVTRAEVMARVKAELSAFNAKAKSYDDLFGEVSSLLPANEASCTALSGKARDAIGIVTDAAASPKAVETQKQRLQSEISALEKAAAKFKSTLSSNPHASVCDERMKEAEREIADSAASVKEVTDLQKEIESKMKVFEASSKVLGQELDRADAFVTHYPVGPVTEPTEYAIKIERTARSTNARTTVVASAPIRLGLSRFSFSAGIAFGFADQKDFVRQASVVNDEVINIVGVNQESDTQVGAVGQLNARIVGNDTVSFLWSLGASITQGAEDTQFGFFTGPTLGLIDDRLFITAAYHLQKEKRLAGGFSRGDVIPDDLEGDIPTTEKTTGALLITVTYRLQ